MNILYESSIFYIITTFLFVLSLFSNIFLWISLWESKDFQFKRVLLDLLQTKAGRSFFWGWENDLKLLAVLYFFATIFNDSLLAYFPIVVFAVYGVVVLRVFWQIIHRTFILPKLSLRNAFLVFLCIVFSVLLYFVPLLDKFFWLLCIDKLVTVVLWGGVVLLSLFSDFSQDVIINKAIRKRSRYPHLIVVGIAGSYGKAEVKEYMYSVLSYKFNVLKTNSHRYLPEEIARIILSGLTAKKQVFLVDMNAYKSGQIALISSLVQPTIGIITAINEHYFALFRSEDKIMEANYELITALPHSGLALFDITNERMYQMYKQTRGKKLSYAAGSTIYKSVDLKGVDIVTKKFSVTFSVQQKDEMIDRFSVQILGEHVVASLLPAIHLGRRLGMSNSEIKKSIRAIRPITHIMFPYLTLKKTTLIDDTYHANPGSIEDAVQYMSHFKGKKICVLQPMTELGEKAKSDHIKVGRIIGSVCDQIFLTNDNFLREIEKGIFQSGGSCRMRVVTPKIVSEYVRTQMGAGDIVLFEGKEALPFLRAIDKEPAIID